jgi:hypothetical protein
VRKTPVYVLKGDLGEWLDDHNEIMFSEVLESVESAMAGEHLITAIPVIILQNDGGSQLFLLKSTEAVKESLTKAMNWFVDTEEYEKAARARDAKSYVEKLKD